MIRSLPVQVVLAFALGYAAVSVARSEGVIASPTSSPSGRVLPFSTLTPGRLRSQDLNNSCDTRTSTIRHVTAADKSAVRRAYGQPPKKGYYTYDHLVPLSLGGDTGRENLWPQPRDEARVKDRCEARAHSLVCTKGEITLDAAQRGFQEDFWKFCASIGIR